MQRREFIAALGGAAAWPLVAWAQRSGGMRQIGILMPFPPTDSDWKSRVSALRQELQRLGWTPGVNIEFDERWTTDNMDLVRANAANLVELKPDVIVALGGRVIPVLMELTSTIPIIIPGAADAVGTGYIKSFARPGGNVTGFATMEFSVIGKILETLKQIAPGTSRVVMIYNPDNPNATIFRRLFKSSASTLSFQPIIAPVHSIADIERAIEAVAEQPNGGVFFPPDVTTFALRDQTTAIVARLRVPAIYTDRFFVTSGGLASYDADRSDIFRRAASYVDRVLRGENPGDLPFQQPTKYQLTINLKTTKVLGITVPPSLLNTADEVIRWADIDTEAGVWIKPAATTKQKAEHRVPLSEAACRLLGEMRQNAGDEAEWIFPAPIKAGHRTDIWEAWETLRRAADIPDVRTHDLRHSFASVLASQGNSLPIIGALLGHTTAATTHRYAHLLDDPLRRATEAASAVITGKPGAKIVGLK